MEDNKNVGILVLESKSLRPFKTKDEYLDAMKEDLAEWFSALYKGICISAENFFEGLETGVLLCQHANNVRRFIEEQKSKGDFELKSNFAREIEIPQYDVQFKVHVKSGTFPARDNISNFITWTAKMGIPEVLRFETDDLVLRKNEGSVVLCLLEVARIGAKFGMLAPTIVQMEEEIDNEIETGEPPPQIKTCDLKSLDEMVRELVGRCTCPIQFPIIKVGEGKYKIGDSQTLVFVRILRSHVMIRVGGGWDTLEHYLDRHDPCRCGFQGSRIGKNVHSTPRRSSQPAASSKLLSSTPKSPRKLSLAAPLTTVHSGKATRPVSPGMRSASPGPNSRKLSLPSKCILSGTNGISLDETNNEMDVTTENTNSKCTPDRQLTISAGPDIKLPIKENISKSGSCNSESFLERSQTSLMQELSSTEIKCPKNHTSMIESCSRSSLRSQSPVGRKRDSQNTYVNGRIRGPSPAPSNHNSENFNFTPSVSAAKRCSSPMKQITFSELRLSREGRLPHLQSSPTDFSTPSKDTATEIMSDSNGLNFTMEKISTMSLVEFRSLLDSTLSVSNGNSESQYSSDSPRSQSSVESGRYMNPMTTSTSAKRSSGNRPVYGTNNVASKTVHNSYINSKSYLNNSTSAYSILNNVSTDKLSQSSLLSQNNITTHAHDLYSNESGDQSPVTSSRNLNNSNVPYHQYANNSSSNSVTDRTQTPPSVARTKANASTVKESYLPSSSRSTLASKSSSYSSLHSCESIDDAYNSVGIETTAQSDIVSTSSSVESELSFKTHSGPLSGVHGAGHSHAKLNASCSGTGNCYQSDNTRNNTCASNESKELIFRDNQIYGSHCSKPLNVGYATFSHDDAIDAVHLPGRNEVKNTNLISCKNTFDKKKLVTSPNDESQSEKYGSTSPCMPSGRQTPSLIPRPITPKLSGKISLPQTNDTEDTIVDDKKNRCRPPTPRKPNVIVRAHNTDINNQGPVDSKLKKRSSTPGPGSAMSTTTSQASTGRSLTPGPYLHKTSTLRPTSATANRSSLNEALAKTGGAKLSVYNSENDCLITSGQQTKTQSFENNHLSKHSTKGYGETVIMVDVDRAKSQHIIAIQGATEVKSAVNTSRPKVLARARAEDNRARSQNKTLPNTTTQRSRSVEPKKLMSRSNSGGGYSLAETPNESVDHKVYDRTQEWVQTAAEQTVQKNMVSKSFDPRSRRAMTPNSFDKKINENNEPRSLEEIKAALQLPINALNAIRIDQLEAPPEDPETFAKMEKLFNEFRMQELKSSVNETPGSTTGVNNNSKTKSSQSSNSNNDDSISVECKTNVKRKIMVTSDKPPPTVSQSMVIPNTTKSKTNSDVVQKSMSNKNIVSNNCWSNAAVPQISSIQQVDENSPKSDVVTGRPPSPRTKSHTPRPASPRTTLQPARPASPRVILKRQAFALTKDAVQTVDTVTPSTILDSSQTPAVRTQPPRSASTPPRSSPSSQSCKSSDDSDNVFETDKKGAGNILHKMKEIIKVNPRKDKSDGVTNKTKIPAPKSLASMGRSLSFTNLSSASHSMSVHDEDSSGNSDVFNGYSENINGALNVTLSGKLETPGQTPKWNTPLTTGRSSLIRKESMEKNKTATGNHLVRAVSVERNMSELKNTYTSYKDEEYV